MSSLILNPFITLAQPKVNLEKLDPLREVIKTFAARIMFFAKRLYKESLVFVFVKVFNATV